MLIRQSRDGLQKRDENDESDAVSQYSELSTFTSILLTHDVFDVLSSYLNAPPVEERKIKKIPYTVQFIPTPSMEETATFISSVKAVT